MKFKILTYVSLITVLIMGSFFSSLKAMAQESIGKHKNSTFMEQQAKDLNRALSYFPSDEKLEKNAKAIFDFKAHEIRSPDLIGVPGIGAAQYRIKGIGHEAFEKLIYPYILEDLNKKIVTPCWFLGSGYVLVRNDRGEFYYNTSGRKYFDIIPVAKNTLRTILEQGNLF
ncbi:MAG: hypothetical protein JSS34_01025 [Proteobacteria bacterium]|nr:hypothetical protein [Pseudomonadota bacterium]